MDKAKSIGSFLLGIAVFICIIIAILLLITFGAKVAFTIYPFVSWLSGTLLILDVIVLIFALIPSGRGFIGGFIYFSSFIFGMVTWIFGLAVTLSLWGVLGVIIGILLGGVGVVPLGLLAAALGVKWGLFWPLIGSAILTYISRLIGALLLSSWDNSHASEEDSYIDVEPVSTRSWKDIES